MPDTGRAESAGGTGGLRFEATVHPRTGAAALERIADLDIDRVPDPEGGVRVLVDAQDCRQLLEAGYEVHLLRAVPVRPLKQRLINSEHDVHAWLDQRMRAAGGSEGS